MPDIHYRRDGRDRQYVSINKHQKNTVNDHSKWESINIEKEAFDNSDYGNITRESITPPWEDPEGNLWGFIESFKIVGTRKEQFGFFPKPTNQIDSWHGYPVFPFTGDSSGTNYGRDIPEDLIRHWVRQGVLSQNKVDRLMRGKRI